jgi:hypothetical protein
MSKNKGDSKKLVRATTDKSGNPIVPKSGKRHPKAAPKDAVQTIKISGTQARYWVPKGSPQSIALGSNVLISYTHECKECAARRSDGFCVVKETYRKKHTVCCSSFTS